MLERVDRAMGRPSPPKASRARIAADPGDLSALLGVLRRRRATIVVTTLLSLAAAIAYLAVATPLYRATASILIDFRRLTPIGQDQLSMNGKVNDAAVDSQAVIIDSSGVAQQVVKALSLDKDPEFLEPLSLPARIGATLWPFDEPETPLMRLNRTIENFGERLETKRVGVSYVVAVSFLSRDPAKAKRIVNSVADAYVHDQLSAKLEAAGTANDWFQSRVKALDAQASEAEKAVVDYRTKNRVMLVDGKFVDEQQVGEISSQLVTARSDRAQAQAKLDQVEALLANGGKGSVTDELSNSVVVQLRQKRADVARRIAETTLRVGTGNESIARLQGDIREIDGAIAAEFRRIADGYRSDAAVAGLREQSLAAKLSELAERSAQSQQVRIELTHLKSVAETLKTMRDTFASRYIEASQEQSFPITEARVISQATQPDKAALPSVKRVLAGGLVVGSGLGAALALLSEALSRRTRTREQIEAAIGAPCVAVVGKLPRGGIGGRALEIAPRHPSQPFAESLRRIRVAVDERCPTRAPGNGTVIAFASPAPGDGTTTVAANFAGVLARRDVPVLLVDLDLRQRSLSRGFADDAGRPSVKRAGLRDLLTGQASLQQAVKILDASGAHLIATGEAGDDGADPTRWLQSAALSMLLETARRHYRYVVLDLPPVIPVGDARAVAGLIDAFLLVVSWNVTTLEEIAEATSLQGGLGGKLVGAVLNKADGSAMERLNDLSLAHTIRYLAPAATAR